MVSTAKSDWHWSAFLGLIGIAHDGSHCFQRKRARGLRLAELSALTFGTRRAVIPTTRRPVDEPPRLADGIKLAYTLSKMTSEAVLVTAGDSAVLAK